MPLNSKCICVAKGRCQPPKQNSLPTYFFFESIEVVVLRGVWCPDPHQQFLVQIVYLEIEPHLYFLQSYEVHSMF